MSEAQVIPFNEKLAELQQKLEALKNRADSITVNNATTYVEAANIRLDIVAYQKALGFVTGPRIEEAKAKLRAEEAAHKTLFDPSAAMLTTVDKKRKDWADEEKRKADEEQRLKQAELNRLAKLKADQDAAEAKKQAEEKKKERIAQINLALKKGEIGKREAAKLLREAGAEAEASVADAEARAQELRDNPPAAPTVTVKPAIPTVRGTRAVQTHWWAEVVNSDIVPDKWWVLDQTALDQEARRTHEKFNVPGVEVKHD